MKAPPSGRRDSNPRPSPWQGDALPAALRPRARRRKTASEVRRRCYTGGGHDSIAVWSPHPPIERWPKASEWLAAGPGERPVDLAVLGVPAFATSISQTGAHATPAAVRRALGRYSTWSASRRIDLAEVLAPWDRGDVEDPDVPVEGEWRVRTAASDRGREVAAAARDRRRQLADLPGDGGRVRRRPAERRPGHPRRPPRPARRAQQRHPGPRPDRGRAARRADRAGRHRRLGQQPLLRDRGPRPRRHGHRPRRGRTARDRPSA